MTASRRFAALLGLALPLGLGALSAPPARASGDLCEPRWRIDDTAALGDCDTTAALSPGNDTRANLLLMLFDRHGLPPAPPAATAKPILGWRDFRDAFAPGGAPSGSTYAAGEGSRCRTNDGGAAAFDAALDAAASLPPDERAALVAARAALKPGCAGASATPATDVPAPAAPLDGLRPDGGRPLRAGPRLRGLSRGHGGLLCGAFRRRRARLRARADQPRSLARRHPPPTWWRARG